MLTPGSIFARGATRAAARADRSTFYRGCARDPPRRWIKRYREPSLAVRHPPSADKESETGTRCWNTATCFHFCFHSPRGSRTRTR